MTYKKVLNYLLEQLPMFQRIGPAAYRTDLKNITALCDILGNPQKDLKCIHVAGTNGKGSVTHIIASILQEQGYKTGVFVSPHYKDYRERIKINGKYIAKSFDKKFVAKNIKKFKTVNASFFEITTAMAFEYFKEKKVDFAIIETGMGGRLDSTNIITPVLSVFTNISYDHQQFLGNTLAKIAKEKAGIVKPGVPVVIGEYQKETKPVFAAAAKANKAEMFLAYKTAVAENVNTDLKGSYQRKNISTALKAIEVLKQQNITISEKSIRKGLKHVRKNTSFIGRWMVVKKHPLTVFDSAHNEAGIKELQKEIKKTSFKHLHIVLGTVNDKDLSKSLPLMPKEATYYFCKADIPRGLDADVLRKEAKKKFGLSGEAYPSVKKAFKAARHAAAKEDMILVTGSIFIVAEVL